MMKYIIIIYVPNLADIIICTQSKIGSKINNVDLLSLDQSLCLIGTIHGFKPTAITRNSTVSPLMCVV